MCEPSLNRKSVVVIFVKITFLSYKKNINNILDNIFFRNFSYIYSNTYLDFVRSYLTCKCTKSSCCVII